MKIMANCDKTCELQLSVNHRIIERTAPLSKACRGLRYALNSARAEIIRSQHGWVFETRLLFQDQASWAPPPNACGAQAQWLMFVLTLTGLFRA